ncbi:MAG: hypothetical protein R3F49_09230 [Planctomycetota bacterium]
MTPHQLTLGLGLLGLGLAPTVAAYTAPFDVVDELLASGQQKLIAGDAKGALEAFEQANGLSSGAPRTELWVLRAQMENGRKNDAMGRVEELEGKGALTERQADYLRGTFSFLVAEEQVAGGSRGGNPGFHYNDAQSFLKLALAANPDAYPDAWRTLADASRKGGDGEGAEVAVRGALQRLDGDPRTNMLAAEILVANGVADLGAEDEAVKAAAQAKVREGIAHAERAAALLGSDRRNAAALASAHAQRGVAQLWLGDKDAAVKAYADAMEWDPTQLDFGQLWGSLQDENQRPTVFVAALAEGAKRFEKRWGKATNADSTMLWWLGFGEQTIAKYEDAEAHFLSAVKKFPAYTNSWWYAGMCRYFRQDYPGAVAHWREHAAASRENLVASISENLAGNDQILLYVEGKRFGNGDDAAGVADAAFIAGVRADATPTNHRIWNNLGLFCRDAGDLLKRAGKDGDEYHTVSEYYERAYSAYERANELAPGKPYYMNDWAVILHYCLDRDHQKALDLYANATEIAERMLKQGGLDDEEKGLVEIALRDSKSNRARLVKLLEERKKREQERTGSGGGQR